MAKQENLSLTGPMAGRTCLVTGANAGIGKETVRGLLDLGAQVVMACRDRGRGEAARSELTDGRERDQARLAIVDVASQRSIRDFASAFVAEHDRLDVLVNNAGVVIDNRELTGEGVERTFATNVLGYHLLTVLLMPLLKQTRGARIVSVASRYAGGLDLKDVQFERRPYGGLDAYRQSKEANRLWTWALSRRLADSGVTANAMHPGAVATELLKKGFGMASGRTPAKGAETVIALASSPEFEGVTGRFFLDRHEIDCEFRNHDREEALYSLCEQMTRLP